METTSFYDGLLEHLRQPPQWTAAQEQVLLEPFEYLTSTPGKELRSLLIDAFNEWLQVPPTELDAIKKIVRLLHTASLLVDDVEDGSDLRRGIPVAHKIYGVPQTINSANYVYFIAYQELGRLRTPTASPIQDLWGLVNEELIHLHRGQGMDLHWRDSLTCPTESEYVAMVNNSASSSRYPCVRDLNTSTETGGLFRMAVKLLMAMSPLPRQQDFVPLANLIGVLFQIRDDYMNLQSSQYAENKGFCEDLTEGKFSFPIVHGIRADTSNQRLLNILRQRTDDVHTKTYAAEYLRSHTGSFAYTLAVLAKLDVQARHEIARLGGGAAVESILDKMRVAGPEQQHPQ